MLISKETYHKNIVVMTILWCFVSFTYYTLLFLSKYFEGSIYICYYLDGASGILGIILGVLLYNCVKIKWSFLITISQVILGLVALLCFEQDYWSPDWIRVFLPEQKSPYHEGSEEEHEFYLSIVVPFVVFYIKVFLAMAVEITYVISFGDEKIFPSNIRATAISYCNIIARSLTVFSSIAAELPRPWPASLLIGLSILAYIASFFLPSYREEIEFEEKIKLLQS